MSVVLAAHHRTTLVPQSTPCKKQANMTTVLITGMGSTTAMSVVKGLRQQVEMPLRIVGIDINRRFQIAGSSFCDLFYTVPNAVDEGYIPELLRICEVEGVQVLFPIIDIELEVIAAHVDMFRSKGVHVWISDLKTVQLCNDKYLTYRFFLENRVATPQTWLPEEVAGREAAMLYPLIVKPTNGVSSVDVFRVESAFELEETLKKVERPIVQEYLEGKEFTIDVVTDRDARLLAVVPRERIETKAGLSYKGKTVRNEKLIEQAGLIAQKLKIKGPCNIQCRVNDGKAKFFEINPRFSGTLPLTIAAGVNSPLLLVKLALGEKPEQNYFDFRAGVYMTRYWEEIFHYED
jgi:carbamoyl-phosphate synthase large subunit